MIRKLAIALSLLGVCFTGLVHALGLGEVTVKSALNQPLKAEIELVNTAGLTVNEILPGLATREEFQKANVDRVYFLSDLRFEVVTNSQGKAHIVLTSKKPVREPFLNFIVELIWPSGRLLREYALLIDPPLFSEQPKAKVETPRTSVKETGDVLSVSTAESNSNVRSILAPSERVVSGSYGPTDANDTLWDIAIKARPNRSVSPQQVMLAIQDLNPDAFINNNINKLKAGQVLRLPNVDQIKERSQHQAIQLVIAQNEANLGKRSPSVVQGSKAQTTPSYPVSTQSVSGDELKLVVSNNDNTSDSTNSANSGSSDQSGNSVDNKLAVTLEKLDKASIENKELNSRVSDLEEQLSTLQRLLTLKNDQLASIQSQIRANELKKLQEQSENTNTAPDESPKEGEMQAAVDDQSDADQQITDETLDSNNDQDVAFEDEASESKDETVAESKLTESQSKGQPALVQDNENPSDNSQQLAPKDSSQNFVQTIISTPLYLSISIIIILIIVFVLWLVSRHNAKREEEFQSRNDFTSDDNVFEESEPLDDAAEDSFSADEDYALDDDQEASEPLTDEVFSEELEDESQDILSEVEAYISYGRLDQAVQVLENAISQDPVRTDFRLKLLSVYKDLGDRQAFDRQFSELEAIQDSAALSAAEVIRQEMQEEEDLAFEADDNLLSRRDIEEQALGQSEPLSSEGTEIEEDVKSFDFDSVTLEEEGDTTEDELDLSSELDLDSLNDSSLSEELNISEESDDDVDMEDVLSLDTDTVKEDTEDSTEDFDDSILDVDLEDLDLNAELDQESEIDLDTNKEGLSLPEVDASDDLVVSDDVLEEAAQSFENDSEDMQLDDDLAESDEFDFLNGTDEASTKLDLARAYIDMGDVEGAKDILLEVTKEGSDAQKAEAQELIDSID